MATDNPRPPQDSLTATALERVAQALGRLRYGAIQLVVHDGRLVQIEVTERQRFG
jgi:hypothetical protein